MPNDKWDDDHIENLLRDFPAIRDDRTKDEVYRRLNQQPVSRKQPKRLLPLMVAALAFITLGMLLASILTQEKQNEYSGAEEQAATTSGQEEGETSLSQDSPAQEERAEESAEVSIMQEQNTATQPSAVYDEDADGHTLFTLGMTENAFVIPVSFLIPNEQITQQFEEEDPGAVEIYKQYADKIDEEALGFDNYHPYAGTLAMRENGIEHILPNDHQYDMASAAIGVYTATIQETFQQAEEIFVLNEDGSQAEFDQVGPVEPISTQVENVAFYAYTTSAEQRYLVPDYGAGFASASEAIEAMKVSPNDFYEPVIPEDSPFTVTETDDVVEIQFAEPFNFDALDQHAAVRLIEGLSLTAKSFGKQVQISNAEQDQWNGFDFTEPLAVPMAPNRLEWPSELPTT